MDIRITAHLAAIAVSCLTVSGAYARVKPPVMGWSSWNAFAVNISDSIIMQQADKMVELGLKDAGYTNINIDDGYFGPRDAQGNMTPHPQRFPRGMRIVADHIHDLGLKAGCYSDAGSNTCGSMWNNDALGNGAGLYGHEDQDAKRYFNDWNFDFIKIDYCGGQQLGLVEKDQYTKIAQTIARYKPEVSINICRWAFPGNWARDIAASWRMSEDIRAKWPSIMSVVNKNLNLSAYARDGHYNDMDMLVVGLHGNSAVGGDGLTIDEEKAHFGLWCIMSSPLLIGADLSRLDSESLKILLNRELIAINQDPLELQAYPLHVFADGSAILVKDILTERGPKRAVAFYNPTDTEKNMSVDLADLELGGYVAVRDLTENTDLGNFKKTFSKTMPPHSATVMSMEGETRLEPSRYEAEWGYMPMFDCIGRNMVTYVPDGNCSNGSKAAFLGNSPENFIEWDKVYSDNGGKYMLRVNYTNGEGHKMWIDVNGNRTFVVTEGGKEKRSISIPVNLNRGFNTIRMGNDKEDMAEIDNIVLAKY
ncbi:MAG: alpha-galactosidase [Muribaculaceae bacterium]|nr:alpha-galactosidase [Muribaculaceae bacterium]